MTFNRALLTAAFALATAPALATPTTVHSQDFEGRGPAWQTHGLWATDESPTAAPGGSAWSGTKSLNFNDGRSYRGLNRGAAASPRLTLPGTGEVTVAFRCNYETETTGTGYDRRSVVVRIDSHVVAEVQLSGRRSPWAGARCAAMGTWHRHELRIPGPTHPGATVDVEFVFDSVDSIANDFAGWFVDDFELIQDVTVAQAFTRLEYSTLDFRDLSTTVEVLADRSVTVRRSSPTARYSVLGGTATAAEWQALTAAVQAGDLASVPATIPDTNVYIVRPTRFSLTVDSAVAANQASISGSAGIYQQWAPQVGPVVDAVRAILARILAAPPTGDDHGDDAASATFIDLNGSQQPEAGAIDPAGDVDWFKVQDTRPFIMIFPPPQYTYVFETTVNGNMDTVIELYALDGTTLLASDDDGGQGLASRIAFTSNAGSAFYVKVRHYSSQGTGTYTLTVGNGSPQTP